MHVRSQLAGTLSRSTLDVIKLFSLNRKNPKDWLAQEYGRYSHPSSWYNHELTNAEPLDYTEPSDPLEEWKSRLTLVFDGKQTLWFAMAGFELILASYPERDAPRPSPETCIPSAHELKWLLL